MICNFVAGQRVVCIQDKWWPFRVIDGEWKGVDEILPAPKRNDIVKIKALMTNNFLNSAVELDLHGYPNQGFCHLGFRPPLNERPTKTSIEVFKKLLTSTKVTA